MEIFNTSNYKNTLLFIVFLSSLVILSCDILIKPPGPTASPVPTELPGPDESPPPVELTAPEDVMVLRSGDYLRVTWEKVDIAQVYQVFRKLGDGTFTKIESSETAVEYWDDYNYPAENTIQYAVKSKAGEYRLES